MQAVVEVTDAAAVQATVEEAEAESSTDAVAVEVGDRDGRDAVGGAGPVGADSLALEASQVQECAEDTHMSGQRQAEVGEAALMSSECQEVQIDLGPPPAPKPPPSPKPAAGSDPTKEESSTESYAHRVFDDTSLAATVRRYRFDFDKAAQALGLGLEQCREAWAAADRRELTQRRLQRQALLPMAARGASSDRAAQAGPDLFSVGRRGGGV